MVELYGKNYMVRKLVKIEKFHRKNSMLEIFGKNPLVKIIGKKLCAKNIWQKTPW